MSFLSNKLQSVYHWWIGQEPAQTKRKREDEDDDDEEVVEERPNKLQKIEEEEEEEEEFFEAVGGEAECTPAQVKRKREEEVVEEPPNKQQKINEEEEEEEFFQARETFEEDEAVAAAAAAAKEAAEAAKAVAAKEEELALAAEAEAKQDNNDEAAPPALIKTLTKEEKKRVSAALRLGQVGIVSQYKDVTVEYKDMYKMLPGEWLNDELINFYMRLLMDRAENNQSLPKIHCFNTFFYPMLRDQGYAQVRRWTRRVDVFAKDLLLIPINRAKHWTLGVIDMKKKEVRVYDSMGGGHQRRLELFLNYLEAEHQDKKHVPLDTSDWVMKTPKDIPQQENTSDCGAFMCTFAERLACRGEFDFSQQDMRILRRRIVLNILDKHL